MVTVSILVSLGICVGSVWTLAELQLRWKRQRDAKDAWLSLMLASGTVINAVHAYVYSHKMDNDDLWLTALRCVSLIAITGYAYCLGVEGKARKVKTPANSTRKVASG